MHIAVCNRREYGKALEFIRRDEEIFAIAEATVENVESHCGYEKCWRDRLALGHASIDVYMPRRTCQRGKYGVSVSNQPLRGYPTLR
jgi:hypothetical protein